MRVLSERLGFRGLGFGVLRFRASGLGFCCLGFRASFNM